MRSSVFFLCSLLAVFGLSSSFPSGSTATAGNGAPQSYFTNFPLVENPISEGGRWVNNGLRSTYARTKAGGKAMGTVNNSGGQGDSYAHLTGFGADQTVQATIFRDPAGETTDTHEVGIHLRMDDSSGKAKTYEINFQMQGEIQIVRWDNSPAGYTYLSPSGTNYDKPFATRDVVKARIAGSTITVWVNDVQVLTVVDSSYATGQPGMNFFKRVLGTNDQYCFTSFRASSP